jgi:hypothetical protein
VSKIQKVRRSLAIREADLQRSYNFEFYSLKIKLIPSQLASNLIVACNHPYFQYTNSGNYRGFIDGVNKPSEITLNILENDRGDINDFFNMWDGLKYNMATGIHYPKSVYEDIAFLTYKGNSYIPSKLNTSSTNNVSNYANAAANTIRATNTDSYYTEGMVRERTYVITGFYPINRESVNLSYDNNSVVTLSVTFNVDDIQPVPMQNSPISFG